MRLFQNFSFWNSFLEFGGKPGFDRFFQELVPKPTGFWNKLQYHFNIFTTNLGGIAHNVLISAKPVRRWKVKPPGTW
jgi:hypothetical protein